MQSPCALKARIQSNANQKVGQPSKSADAMIAPSAIFRLHFCGQLVSMTSLPMSWLTHYVLKIRLREGCTPCSVNMGCACAPQRSFLREEHGALLREPRNSVRICPLEFDALSHMIDSPIIAPDANCALAPDWALLPRGPRPRFLPSNEREITTRYRTEKSGTLSCPRNSALRFAPIHMSFAKEGQRSQYDSHPTGTKPFSQSSAKQISLHCRRLWR